ncbi:MAG: PAS domain-containing protein [Myxococcales bacterium]|nr:PAS domain-containing protein [Myxococcales bacterium]
MTTAAPVDAVGPGGPTLARRLTRLMLVRTVIISLVLGLSLWLGSGGSAAMRAPAERLLLGVVVVTYLSTIVYAVAMRRGVAPERLVWPQLAADLAITTVLVYVTGGAQSAYTFFYALSVVGAGAVTTRRGASVTAVVSIALAIAVGLAAWTQALPLPTIPQVEPWTQSPRELAVALGRTVGALVAVGVLAVLFVGELQRTQASLVSQRQVAADLVALNRDIVRSLSSGLLTIDDHGRVLTINQTGLDVLGANAATAVGGELDAVMPGLGARLAALAPTASLRRTDLTLPGEPARTIGITVSPLRDDADQVIGRVINFSDLTDLRRLEGIARRNERLATVGQLAAGVAHEIRNPLASISGSIELLSQSAPTSEDDRALMAIVLREIDRLNVLITELLDYANPRPRAIAPLDLAVMLDDVIAVLRQDRSWGPVAIAADDAGPLALEGDAAQLRQVVWNLARNACEAAAAGGGHVQLRARVDGAAIVLDVTDDGPGIAADHLAHIFDPFYTTKRKGTGLGLATCHAIVAEHGGTIDVASKLGQGATFTVRLPRPG